jgi:hypothetical protein
MDTPQKFLKDVVDADAAYGDGFSTDLLVGNFRLELFGLSEEAAKAISAPAIDPLVHIMNRNAQPLVNGVKEVIDYPPKCIDDLDLYQSVQYFAKVEGPYARDFIKNTLLKDSVEIPAGTDEFMEQLGRIPLCD